MIKPVFAFSMDFCQRVLVREAADRIGLTESEWGRRAVDQVLRDGLRNKQVRPADLARKEGHTRRADIHPRAPAKKRLAGKEVY